MSEIFIPPLMNPMETQLSSRHFFCKNSVHVKKAMYAINYLVTEKLLGKQFERRK